MNNNDILYDLLLEELNKKQDNRSGISTLKDRVNKINSYGKSLSKAGDYFNNQKLSAFGNSIQNGTSSINNVLNKPNQYTSNAINNGLSKAGDYFSNQLSAEGLGNVLNNAGNYLANGAATTAGTTAAAETAASTGAALGSGAAAGTAAGSTAGGAAAGSAAGGSSAAMAGGPIGAIIALATMALTGANRKRSKQSAEQSKQMSELALQEADQQTEQTVKNASNLIPNKGTMTGGAAPIVDNLLTQYQDYLRQNGYDENTVNGVAQGLNGGYKDIAEWQNQYAQSKDGQNAGYRIPQTEEEIALAKVGNFNVANPIQTGEVSATGKKSWLNNLANGLSDLSKGYNENKNTPFSPDNLRPDDNKNKMTRTGEALGTIARIAQTPAGQGAIAGLVTGIATGNPFAGISNAYKFANQRQMSDIYNQVLKEQGINVPVGTYGNLKANDINAVMTPQYKDALNNIALAKLEEQKNYHDTMAELKRESNENLKNYRESNIKIKQQNADTQAYKAKNGTTVNHKGSSSKTPTAKPQNHEDWNKNLSEFTSIYNSGDVDKTDYARAAFIKIHGVDPLKYIKG